MSKRVDILDRQLSLRYSGYGGGGGEGTPVFAAEFILLCVTQHRTKKVLLPETTEHEKNIKHHTPLFESPDRGRGEGILKPFFEKIEKNNIFSFRTEIPTFRFVFHFGLSRSVAFGSPIHVLPWKSSPKRCMAELTMKSKSTRETG